MPNPTVGYLYLQNGDNNDVGVEVTIQGLNKQQASDFAEEVLTLARTKYGADIDKISFFGLGPTMELPKGD